MTSLVVDRKGLAKKLGNRPKSFILFELISNSWDEKVTTVTVEASMVPSRPVCTVVVEDDSPEGFQNLESIYTLFRDSKKSNNPELRGRFELGEKLVAAIAHRMEVCTTKGTIIIEGDERKQTRHKTDAGSIIRADVPMTRSEFDQVCEAVSLLLPPEGITTIFNGQVLKGPTPLKVFEALLQTVVTDGEGNLTRSYRRTKVHVHACRSDETGYIYELGIPVVETGDGYHYDVQQKVPVNWERNNVPPSFLKTLRVEALNAMHAELDGTSAIAPWVSDAIDDERCSSEAIKGIVQKRYGDKAVIFDPSDPEGTKIAVTQGYTVVPGGALSKGAWDNIRKSRALLPAGQVTPSPKPYSPDGHPENVISRIDWTDDMCRRAEFSESLFERLIGESLEVVIVKEPSVSWTANFGGTRLCLNYGRLGKNWFAQPNRNEAVLDLLLHEFCHSTCLDHLSHEMHETATRLGAKLAQVALNEPELFQ